MVLPLYQCANNYFVYFSTVPKIGQFIQGAKLLFLSVLLVMAIVFAETKQAGRTCRNIVITIAGGEGQRFVEKPDLLAQLTANATAPIFGTPLQALKTRSIEDIVKTNNFVRKGVVYKNWQGELKIAIVPRRPIARIIYPHQQSQYVDEDGTLLSLSDRYTARVLLVEVAQLRGVQKNLTPRSVSTSVYRDAMTRTFEVSNYLRNEVRFWRKQEPASSGLRPRAGRPDRDSLLPAAVLRDERRAGRGPGTAAGGRG